MFLSRAIFSTRPSKIATRWAKYQVAIWKLLPPISQWARLIYVYHATQESVLCV